MAVSVVPSPSSMHEQPARPGEQPSQPGSQGSARQTLLDGPRPTKRHHTFPEDFAVGSTGLVPVARETVVPVLGDSSDTAALLGPVCGRDTFHVPKLAIKFIASQCKYYHWRFDPLQCFQFADAMF
eukprot:scaffold365595_cov38-Prasinocladus_malaysianus.AAC.1